MSDFKHSIAYVRFLSLLDAIRGEADFPVIDATERLLLERLASLWHTGQTVTVLRIMNDETLGLSPSTVHRRLKSLRSLGMIALDIDLHDHRTKYVVPTPKTQQYFDRLGRCMAESGLQPSA